MIEVYPGSAAREEAGEMLFERGFVPNRRFFFGPEERYVSFFTVPDGSGNNGDSPRLLRLAYATDGECPITHIHPNVITERDRDATSTTDSQEQWYGEIIPSQQDEAGLFAVRAIAVLPRGIATVLSSMGSNVLNLGAWKNLLDLYTDKPQDTEDAKLRTPLFSQGYVLIQNGYRAGEEIRTGFAHKFFGRRELDLAGLDIFSRSAVPVHNRIKREDVDDDLGHHQDLNGSNGEAGGRLSGMPPGSLGKVVRQLAESRRD